MNRHVILLFSLGAIFGLCFQISVSQTQIIVFKNPDTVRRALVLNINLIQASIDEYNAGLIWRPNARFSVGMNVGLVYANKYFRTSSLGLQENFPGTVYHGTAFRLLGRLYSRQKQNNYWSIQFVTKNVAYDSLEFLDMYKGEHEYAEFRRSENSRVLGLTFLRGHEFYLLQRFLVFDIFYGLEFRSRTRNLDTYFVNSYPHAGLGPNLGKSKQSQNYLVPLVQVPYTSLATHNVLS